MELDRRGFVAGAVASPNSRGARGAPPDDEQRVRAIIDPWYSLFTIVGRGDVRAVFDRVIAPDFVSYRGELPSETTDREGTIPFIETLATLVPDMRFEIRELLIAGDRVAVRGRATGTPSGDLFGQPHTGRSFQIMTIDILTLRGSKIVSTHHLENWLGALDQLRGK